MKLDIITSLSDYFEKNEIIKTEEKELFTYGLQQGLIMVLNILSSLLIGFLFGMILESIIFMIAYIPLRMYAGGYHARTQFRCYVLSIGIIGIVLGIIRFAPWNVIICLVTALLAGSVIFILAPREDANKPLDEIEKILYKKRTRRMLFMEGILIAFTVLMGWDRIAVCVSMALVALGAMLLMDGIKVYIGQAVGK